MIDSGWCLKVVTEIQVTKKAKYIPISPTLRTYFYEINFILCN